MDKLKIAYKILHALDTNNGKAEYVGQVISPDVIGVDDAEWLAVVEMLIDEGYIKGAKVWKDIIGDVNVNVENCKITLKGVEYLHENSAMKKIGRVATNVIKIVKP